MSLASNKQEQYRNDKMRMLEKLMKDLVTIPEITLSYNSEEYGMPEYHNICGGSFHTCLLWPYTIQGNETPEDESKGCWGSHGHHACNYSGFRDDFISHFSPDYYLHFSNWDEGKEVLTGHFGFRLDKDGFHIKLADLLENCNEIYKAIFE